MTDEKTNVAHNYPTADEVKTADDILRRIQLGIDDSAPHWALAHNAIELVRELLDAFDVSALGLKEPEPAPKPKPTPAQALFMAWRKADDSGAKGATLWAAFTYAEEHPEWFAEWYQHNSPDESLWSAAVLAHDDDQRAYVALAAACGVAKARPDLFGDTR